MVTFRGRGEQDTFKNGDCLTCTRRLEGRASVREVRKVENSGLVATSSLMDRSLNSSSKAAIKRALDINRRSDSGRCGQELR